MSLLDRQIQVVIALGTGNFGDTGKNTVTLDGLRVHANITKVGAPGYDAAEIRVYGLPLSMMNTLSKLGAPIGYPRVNTITLNAGDTTTGMSQVFQGIIYTSYGDFSAMPEVCLVVTSMYNLTNGAKPAAPLSFPKPVQAATVVAQIAAQMGLGFINNGVSVTFSGAGGGGPYLPGSSLQQLQTVASAGNFNYTTSGGNAQQSVEIWPKGTARGAMGPLVSPDSGLVVYPEYSDAGATIVSLYRPGFGTGQAFTLQTSIDSAAGTWFVVRLNYELECNNPTGSNPWFITIDAQRSTLAS